MKNEIVINLQDCGNRFLTYYNYLCSLQRLIDLHSSEENIVSKIIQSDTYHKIQTRKHIDFSRVAEFLRNSWFTEEQIHISVLGNNSPFSNHWMPIQMYYSAYLQIRALAMVKNPSASSDHRNTMKFIANYIGSNSDAFAFPWCALCSGTNENPVYKNFPYQFERNKISTLRRLGNEDLQNSLALFLKTTRKRVLDKIVDEYKEKNRIHRISMINRQTLLDGMGETSLFDCLYRLRIRSNYEDADSFIASISMSKEAAAMGNAIRTITSRSMFGLELLIMRHIGKNVYEEIVKNFNKSVKKCSAIERWNIIKNST